MMPAEAETRLNEAQRELDAAMQELRRLFLKWRVRAPWTWADADFPGDSGAPDRHTVDELEQADYEHLAPHAQWFDGSPQALKYFIPRITHDYVRGWKAPVELKMFVSRLRETTWWNWAAEERLAVERFFWAWLSHELCWEELEGAERDAGDILEAIAFSGLSLQSLLDSWHKDTAPATALRITRLVEDLSDATSRKFLDEWGHVWGDQGVSVQTIREVAVFIRDAAFASKLEQAFFAVSDQRSQARLSQALQTLEAWRANAAESFWP